MGSRSMKRLLKDFSCPATIFEDYCMHMHFFLPRFDVAIHT